MSTYRKVGRSSNIDESLFGGPIDRERAMSGGMSTFSSSSSKRSMKGSDMKTPIPPSAIVLTASELQAIKVIYSPIDVIFIMTFENLIVCVLQRNTLIKSEAELKEEQDMMEALREEKDRKQKERKTRMIELGENAKRMAKKSDIEIRKEAQEVALRKSAGEKRDEDSDVVKLLRTLASRAAAFTVRDSQLGDREQREKEHEEYERRMDTVMEIDRLRDIQRREAEEDEKRKKRFDDRKVITEQIQERQRMRLIAAEAREQENQAMKNLMKKYQDEDEIKAERRKAEMALSRTETIAMNEQAIFRKRQAKEAVKKEMEDILIYQAMKDAEMAKREEDEAAVERMKKERQLKLLGQQEKAMNRAGELDELRARRAAEERERRARKKEYDEFTKKKNDMKELVESRVHQARDKKEREAANIIFQEEEYRNALMHMSKAAEREDRETRMKKDFNNTHRIMLNKQIKDDEVKKHM